MANETSIVLPAEVLDRARTLAIEQNCTLGELMREALNRYEEHGHLMSAIASGQDRSDALDDFIMKNVDRVIHEYRAEKRALAEAS